MGAQPIKTWSLMKQSLRNKFGVENHEEKDKDKIQSQFLNFLTITCGTKSNHGMKAKEEGMGKELSMVVCPLCDFGWNVMINPFTCDLAFDIDHMLKCSSPCAYLEKQLLVSIARIKPSYHALELVHDNLFFDLLVDNFSSSCASMWSKIHIFFGSFAENCPAPTIHSRFVDKTWLKA
ncbi:hypothetical protein M9H77_36518 [Catharanthus roseus]|uniref:Uncharacterized protein n=1 Tax=Catharanthus roseus TaxID=4058 RepID=A0ACB9ZU00_CATRO|nr:hypothetical protein M9H77_36518 [Catharanthus roseus]